MTCAGWVHLGSPGTAAPRRAAFRRQQHWQKRTTQTAAGHSAETAKPTLDARPAGDNSPRLLRTHDKRTLAVRLDDLATQRTLRVVRTNVTRARDTEPTGSR